MASSCPDWILCPQKTLKPECRNFMSISTKSSVILALERSILRELLQMFRPARIAVQMSSRNKPGLLSHAITSHFGLFKARQAG